jgi:hypothetical protein
MSEIEIFDTTDPSCPATPFPLVQAQSTAPAFDVEEYRADISDLGLTGEQETEFLETLWSIMGHFARLGFSVDVCGLIFAEFNEASAPAAEDGKLVPSTNMESASEPSGDSI